MTLGELRTFLSTRDLPDEALVVLAFDDEGSCSPLLECSVGDYTEATNTGSDWGTFTDEDDCDDEPVGQRAICLWPTE